LNKKSLDTIGEKIPDDQIGNMKAKLSSPDIPKSNSDLMRQKSPLQAIKSPISDQKPQHSSEKNPPEKPRAKKSGRKTDYDNPERTTNTRQFTIGNRNFYSAEFCRKSSVTFLRRTYGGIYSDLFFPQGGF